MSTLSYEQEYRQVLADIQDLQQEDVFLTGVSIPSDPRSRNSFFLQFRVSTYLRYLKMVQKLSLLHHVELQPQKLIDVRTTLDCCIGRMLELKHFLVANCGDYVSLDNLMLDMKLSPSDVEVPIPSYIINDRKEELKDRRNVILSLQRYYAEADPDAPVTQALQVVSIRDDPTKAIPPLPTKKPPQPLPKTLAEIEQEPLDLEEAIKVLQICERGRQARQRAKFQLALFHQQRYSLIHGQDFNTLAGKDRAATIIQTVVLGYLERKRAAERLREEELFLGLKPSPQQTTEAAEEDEAATRRIEERKAKQKMNVMSLQQVTTELEAHLKASEGPKTMECMLDEILLHMAYARLENKDGQLVELPSHEEGGSLKLLGKLNNEKGGHRRRLTIGSRRPSRALSDLSNSKRSRSRASSGDLSKERASHTGSLSGAGGGEKAKKKGRKEEEELTEPLPNSAFWAHLADGKERYDNLWKQKFTNVHLHEGNMDLSCDENMIRQQLLEGPKGIMQKLRRCVDDLVMVEVSNLKERMEWERKNKRKKKKKPKPKKAKKLKLKDPTKGVDLPAMTNMVVYENKLQLPPSSIRLNDFVGPENYFATPWDQFLRHRKPDDELKKKWTRVLRGWNEQVECSLNIPLPKMQAIFEKYLPHASWLTTVSAAEIRRAVTEYAILPLGSQVINDLAPHGRTMLFYGFPRSGKTMVTYAICNEAGATLYNLSPGNFSAMKGIAKQIQTVFYLAKMSGPSVIYIEDAEKIFSGERKGKADPLKKRGKKIKKELLKGINSLLPIDRVMVIFVTNEPWNLDQKAVEAVFHHAVFFGPPDYATRMELLQLFISQKLEGKSGCGLSMEGLQQLALLSEGLSAGQLQSLVDIALYPRRVDCIAQRPLEVQDFVGALSVAHPPSPEDVSRMVSFHETLPVHLRRANPAEDFPESEDDAKKRKGGGEKKK